MGAFKLNGGGTFRPAPDRRRAGRAPLTDSERSVQSRRTNCSAALKLSQPGQALTWPLIDTQAGTRKNHPTGAEVMTCPSLACHRKNPNNKADAGRREWGSCARESWFRSLGARSLLDDVQRIGLSRRELSDQFGAHAAGWIEPGECAGP